MATAIARLVEHANEVLETIRDVEATPGARFDIGHYLASGWFNRETIDQTVLDATREAITGPHPSQAFEAVRQLANIVRGLTVMGKGDLAKVRQQLTAAIGSVRVFVDDSPSPAPVVAEGCPIEHDDLDVEAIVGDLAGHDPDVLVFLEMARATRRNDACNKRTISEGTGLTEKQIRTTIPALKQAGLVESVNHRGGGIWLTPLGVNVAAAVPVTLLVNTDLITYRNHALRVPFVGHG